MVSQTISDQVYRQCTSDESVSTLLAANDKLTPGEAAKQLYHPDTVSISEGTPPEHRNPASDAELQRAFECGKWGPTRPSNFFLRIFHDSLLPLNHDPLMGCCSPSLVGTCGVIPLTIIGPLPDICRHMSNLIARAEHEVLLATNFWMHSEASSLITEGLKELSRRVGAKGKRAVVKVIYDRADIKQALRHHETVAEKAYTGPKIRLPSAEEAPNLDIEVINFHQIFLGTFHAKFMVVDRKIAVVSSNNIQDNDNVEMMSQYEGPIVDSLHDAFLISWHNRLDPVLPTLKTPAAQSGLPTFNETSFRGLFDENGTIRTPTAGSSRTLQQVADEGKNHDLRLHTAVDPHWDPDTASETTRIQSVLTPTDGTRMVDKVTEHLNLATHQDRKGTAPEIESGKEWTPYMPHPVHELFPMAIVSRKPYGALNHAGLYVPQNEAWLSAIRNASSNIFIQSPDVNAAPLLPELLAAIKRGIDVTYYVCLGYNDFGELLPRQGGHNEAVSHKLWSQLSTDEERARLRVHFYVGKDMVQPIHNKFKGRSCHIKLMIVDDCVGIMGSGNQDTQSWYHSQEVNVMVDSKEVCRRWREGIDRNQNTKEYGGTVDGVWRDAEGNQAEGAMGPEIPRFAWARGILGAVARVRGVGGF